MFSGRAADISDTLFSRLDFSSPDQTRQSDIRRQKTEYMENVNSRKRTFEMNSNTKMRKSDRKLAKQNKPKFMQQVRTGWSNT